MGIYRLIILFLLGALTLQVEAQDEFVPIDGEPRIKVVFYKKVQKEFYQGDSITVIIMPELPVYPPLKFKNKREAMRYNKLVYNVKKTLPIAKMVNQTISETYEYLEKLPTKKEKDAHIRAVEKGIKKQYIINFYMHSNLNNLYYQLFLVCPLQPQISSTVLQKWSSPVSSL